MSTEFCIPVFDLVLCLSQALDFVSPEVNNHHKRVAYISFKIAEEAGLSESVQKNIVLAAALHDIGGLTLKDRLDALSFEFEEPHKHANIGADILKTFSLFSDISEIVRFHHVPWQNGEGEMFEGSMVSMSSHVIHLADRAAILIEGGTEILSQADSIRHKIRNEAGNLFNPGFVDAFLRVSEKEYFWFDSISDSNDRIIRKGLDWGCFDFADDSLLELAHLFRRVIDFRSPFTATHSSGVAACAQAIAGFAGFSEYECRLMLIAGYMHDLGKIAVPTEIIDKPGKLTREEFDVMRHHTYYTDRILGQITGLDIIRSWAANHHERLDGTGYPFHLKAEDLSLGSRIMAVADVFVALTEDRPYRKGMTKDEALASLDKMVDNLALDSAIISLVKDNFACLDSIRIKAQDESVSEYREIICPFQ